MQEVNERGEREEERDDRDDRDERTRGTKEARAFLVPSQREVSRASASKVRSSRSPVEESKGGKGPRGGE